MLRWVPHRTEIVFSQPCAKTCRWVIIEDINAMQICVLVQFIYSWRWQWISNKFCGYIFAQVFLQLYQTSFIKWTENHICAHISDSTAIIWSGVWSSIIPKRFWECRSMTQQTEQPKHTWYCEYVDIWYMTLGHKMLIAWFPSNHKWSMGTRWPMEHAIMNKQCS